MGQVLRSFRIEEGRERDRAVELNAWIFPHARRLDRNLKDEGIIM